MDIISHAVLPYLLGRFFSMDRNRLAAFVIGGVAPDLDIFIIWLGLIFPSPDLLLVHRGITHSLIFGFLTALAALILISQPPGRDIFRRYTGFEFKLSLPVAGLAFVGVLMHLFLDYIITKGVPLLYPLETARFSAELLFHYEIIILACSVSIALWLIRGFFSKKPVSRKTNNALLVLILIVLLAVGGARVEGKERAIALEAQENIAGNIKGDFEVFPDWGLFQWTILSANESSYQVYSYNSISNNISYLASYPRMHLELDSGNPGPLQDLNDAQHIANSHPKVVLFSWRACAVAVNASWDDGSWIFEYYDPVSRVGTVKDPIWLKEMGKRSPPLRVRVVGNQAQLIGRELKD